MPPLMPTLAPAPSIIRAGAGAARCAAQPSTLSPSPASVVVAGFSTTASRPKFTKVRRLFRRWEKTTSFIRKHPTPGRAQYLPTMSMDLGENHVQPFPMNPHFKSARVLDDRSRELIWEKIVRDGNTIKAVSAEFGVDIRRVAAIVRLKEVEKDWIAKDISLAKPYARAVQSMLPTFRLKPDMNSAPYEPINELHVHPYTMQQIFWPTSESRHFTREDAAKAFHPKMLSADKRVPHPELIQMERDIEEGVSPYEASERFKQAAMESERKAAQKQIARVELEEKQTTRVNTERFEFRFKQFNANEVGSRGRARNAVGWRYGNPHGDRAKGHQIKIPTSVP